MDITGNYRELFLKTALSNVMKLKQGLASLREPNPQREIIEQMHIAAHSLKGEGAMMGFPQFAALSTVIEKYLKGKKEGNEAITEPTIILLSSAVDKLSQSLDEIKGKNTETQLTFETDMLAKQLGVDMNT